MGEKDKAEKQLEDYTDVFADIVNALLFDGDQVVDPGQLVDCLPRSVYKADGKLHDQERDTAKIWKNGEIRISIIGLENQTESDPDMPLRVISYDGASYRSELLKNKENDKAMRYPVVTLVLYFGYLHHWDKPLTLKQCFSIPECLEPYVSDYKINLFEIAWLSDEQLKLFHGDFRIVADFFVQMRKNKKYVPSNDEIQHVRETLELMSVLTGDHKFEEYNNEKMKGGPTSMIHVLDEILEQGVDKGELQAILKLMKNRNMTFDQAADFIGYDKNEKEKLREAMNKSA